jgi:hypothetical protein
MRSTNPAFMFGLLKAAVLVVNIVIFLFIMEDIWNKFGTKATTFGVRQVRTESRDTNDDHIF